MKTIKIFLASSEELKHDRDAFGNLVRRLDDIYEKRGIRLKLCPWEDFDAAYNNRRKQDEYNDYVRASDLFLALFHIKAGKFTIEEFNVAKEEFRKHASPKVFVYCKDLQPDEQESAELTEFKRLLYEELGHYWCRYGNSDTMQLHFVMQLQLVENSRMETLKVEEDGRVTLDGIRIAHMDQLPFAADNEAYQKMSAELLSLPDEIDKARQRVKKYPDDKDLKDELQKKLNRYNQLKEDFKHLQENLFAAAKMITNLQLQQVNARVRRAIEAFEAGDLERANTILDENEREADRHIEQLEQNQELVHQNIDALQLQAKTVIADVNVPIADRIARVTAIYAKANDWAQRSSYDKKKLAQLLFNYANFLRKYALYEEAKQVYLRQIALSEEIYGPESKEIARSYNNIGLVYLRQGDYSKALDYHSRGMSIDEQVYGPNHPNTASSYNNIGLAYDSQGDYSKALFYYDLAMSISEQIYGHNHPDTAVSYNNIGGIYYSRGDYSKALEYYACALSIREQVHGSNHPDTAASYNNIGLVYCSQEDFPKALEYYGRAMSILEQVYGPSHPETATSYNNIGTVYYSQGNYSKALEYYGHAMSIWGHVYGPSHPDTALSYNNIGMVYHSQGDYPKALEYYGRAMSVREQVYGPNHPETATSYNSIGKVYYSQGDFSKALEYYGRAMSIREQVYGSSHPETATSYNNVGTVYCSQGDYPKALEYHNRAMSIREQVYGPKHSETAASYNNIGVIFDNQGNYPMALEYYQKALDIFVSILGSNHPNSIKAQSNIDTVKKVMRQGTRAKTFKGSFWSRLFGKKK